MHTFTGRITRNANLHEFDGGKSIVSFTIVENNSYVNKDKKLVEKPYFVQCEIWNRKNLVRHLKKGMLLQVEGELGVRAFIKDKDTHHAKAVGVQQLTVRELKFLDSKNKTQGSSEQPAAATTTPPAVTGTDADDLPF
ncbi:MAG: single-stranded DNA-binding protein [Puia sp.]|nr:single-stranded DNA-binding protein [Puia sp.]